MPTSSAKNKKAPPRERPVFGHRSKSGGRSDSWMGAKPKMEWGERKTPLDKGRGISLTDVTVHRTADADKGFVHSSAKDHVKNRMDEDQAFGHRKNTGGHGDDWLKEKPKMELGEKKTALDKGRGISVDDPEDEQVRAVPKKKLKVTARKEKSDKKMAEEVPKAGGCGCAVM
mmetsp:Transcript_10500/g.19025  ORF Transcript_10500/g.19025 Transcript_10500/m.19025 type:complete len:172 (+) Transcript_10500:94-609(+)